MLTDDINIKISEQIENNFAVENVAAVHYFAKLYNLNRVAETTLSYFELHFPMVVETQSFLELEYSLVLKILKSSDLNLHSELEVYNAAESWLKHNGKERSKFAKQLLLAVRFPLLSDQALKHILDGTSSFAESRECVGVLKEISADGQNFFQNKSSVYYTNRYCDQDKFNVLVCGHYKCGKFGSTINQIDGNNFQTVKCLPSMIQQRTWIEAAYLKGEIYVFGENGKSVKSVEKYSISTGTWHHVAEMNGGRWSFCACPFMDRIVIIGGCFGDKTTNLCSQFDPKERSCKIMAAMNEARYCASCAVFDGRIVVAGGQNFEEDYRLDTVESYDFFADKWTQMPDMYGEKVGHSLVAVRNKLFVIDYDPDTCEVFDKTSGKFVALESPFGYRLDAAISIGNKIVIIESYETETHVCYDVNKDEWYEESNDKEWCEITKNLRITSCVKIPRH